MKSGLFFIFLFALGNAWAQAGRGTAAATGANPLPTNDKGTTRALVVGISEYADSGIVDLRFAHRDAEIFADYLYSAVGAGLPSENVRLLTNGQATLAAIDDGLNWLIVNSKKGDRVIVYFSGHGDVEKQTLWQRGYLLAHDTPGHNYRNNAVKVEDLDEIVKTLSVNNEARVTVILDACRSGKLANIGPTLTAEQLEKQVENEVRILSCKPDQRSLEGEGWGQGRGLFSFFLVNGLMGLADAGSFPDGIITLDELTGFVKTGMQQVLSDPSFTSRQNPVFVGDESYEVGEVNDNLLAAVKNLDLVAMASPGMKGVVEKGVDSAGFTNTSEYFPPPSEVDVFHEFFRNTNLGDYVTKTDFPAIIASQSTDAINQFFLNKIAEQLKTDKANYEAKKALLKRSKLDSLVADPIFQNRFRGLLTEEFVSEFWKVLAPEANPDFKLLHQPKYYQLAKDNRFFDLHSNREIETALRFLWEQIAFTLEQEMEANTRQNALFEQISTNLEDPGQHQQAQLKLAIALHDQAQEAINDYLRGDPGSLDKRHYKDQAEKYEMYPRMLEAALALLPQGHLLRKRVEVKLHYFRGVCLRLANQMTTSFNRYTIQAIDEQKKALALDDKAAYVHNELGILWLLHGAMKKSENHFRVAAHLAPGWALPHANLCTVLHEMEQFEEALLQGDTAIMLQPDYFGIYVNLGNLQKHKGNLLKAETLYRKARELNDAHYLPFERRAFLQLETGRYEEADWQFYEMELRKQGMVAPIGIPNVVATPMAFYNPPFDYPSISGPGVLDENPKTAQAAFLSGKYYFEQNRMNEAIGFFKKAKQLDPSHKEVYYYLGTISKTAKDYEAAEVYFSKLIELRPEVEFMPFFLAAVYHDWQRPIEEEVIYRRFIANSKDTRILTKAHLQLSELLDLQKRFSDRELVLWSFQKINDDWANYELAAFYSNMVYTNPNNTDWLFRYADFNKKHGEGKMSTALYEQLLINDSLHAASAYIHALLGKYYLEETPKPEFSETRQNWKLEFPKAVQHLKSALALAPSLPSAQYDLARACTSIFEYDEALSVLRNLRDSNDLNLSSRLLLADLEMREGNTEIASGLLQKAVDMLPATTHELASLQGNLSQLKAMPKAAIENFKTAFSIDKEDSNTAYSIARLYANLGSHDEALNWLDTAIANHFGHKLVIKYDPAWEAFRNETKFVEMVKRIEKDKN